MASRASVNRHRDQTPRVVKVGAICSTVIITDKLIVKMSEITIICNLQHINHRKNLPEELIQHH